MGNVGGGWGGEGKLYFINIFNFLYIILIFKDPLEESNEGGRSCSIYR